MPVTRDPSDRVANILLLTATITPPVGVPFLARTDPALRLQDYEQALAFYLTLVGRCVDEVVVAENSNSDVSRLRALAERPGQAGRVEFLVFDGLDHPAAYGRGYGEFKLIDHVMAHSRAVRAHGGRATVWKVTGRYVVKNLGRIIERRPAAFDLYCNVRNWPRRWADMYLLAWSAEGYRALIQGYCEQLREENSRVSPEVRFRDLVEAAPAGVKVIPRFTVTPLIEGVRGQDNRAYSQGRNLLKFYLRSALRAAAPWLWV
jgi:hypothetical protein